MTIKKSGLCIINILLRTWRGSQLWLVMEMPWTTIKGNFKADRQMLSQFEGICQPPSLSLFWENIFVMPVRFLIIGSFGGCAWESSKIPRNLKRLTPEFLRMITSASYLFIQSSSVMSSRRLTIRLQQTAKKFKYCAKTNDDSEVFFSYF